MSLSSSQDPLRGLKRHVILFAVADWHLKLAEEPTPTITWPGIDRRVHKIPDNNTTENAQYRAAALFSCKKFFPFRFSYYAKTKPNRILNKY